ncbi:MAG: hypothetical protein ABEJ91_04200, partial [Candidatus Nanohaloarchaea archaeon]
HNDIKPAVEGSDGKMKEILKKVSTLVSGLPGLASLVAAHSGEPGSWMMDGWMHTGSHMTGYGMWGMGWYGALFGLALWILVILGIVYLYQQVTEEEE